jgi:hydrogenase expression/formation protein HypC
MCLAVPGRILSVAGEELTRTGQVDFAGVVKEVSLAYVPEAQVGNYVLVHVGVALNTVDETEAERTLDYLRQIGELAEQERSSDP